MVMEASPAAALEVIESQLILELLVIALEAPAQLGEMHEGGEGRVVAGRVESQYVVGSGFPRGHSMSSHSSVRGVARCSSRWAGRTRIRADRERRVPRVPSRHVTLRHAVAGTVPASCW